MGVLMSHLFSRLFEAKKYRLLILGLDNAGKTTILYRLHLGNVVQTTPTVGFNVETLCYKNVKIQVWDLGGQSSIRPFWRCYYPNADAIVYVIDSADESRLSDSHQELEALLNEEELAGKCLLVYANKQDLAEAMTEDQISEGLGLVSLRDRQWALFLCSAITGDRITEGFDWLTSTLSSTKS